MGTDQYVYLPVKVTNRDKKSVELKAFIDSGCTFNAISSKLAEDCGLEVITHDNDIKCNVGGGNVINIKRKVARISLDLLELGSLETWVFVMDPIPMGTPTTS